MRELLYGVFFLSLSVLILWVQEGGAEVNDDVDIVVFSGLNRTGRKELVRIGNCLNVDEQQTRFRSKVPVIRSVDPRSACLHVYQYDCCQGEYVEILRNNFTVLNYFTRQVRHENGTEFFPRSIRQCRMGQRRFLDAPSSIDDLTTVRNGEDPNTNLKAYETSNIAAYFSFDQNNTRVSWLYDFMNLGWAYVKLVYGNSTLAYPTSNSSSNSSDDDDYPRFNRIYGREGKLYGIFHRTNENRNQSEIDAEANILTSAPASYLQGKGQCRNVITLRMVNENRQNSTDLDNLARLMSEIVDSSFNGTIGSPNYKWSGAASMGFAHIFAYDLYQKLGMTEDAKRIQRIAEETISNVPTRGTRWWSRWFFYLHQKFGGALFFRKYFELRHRYFYQWEPNSVRGVPSGSRSGNSNSSDMVSGYRRTFTRAMNLGEYIHFCSAAAGKDLTGQAEKAFRFMGGWRDELYDAQDFFPKELYKLYEPNA